MDKIPVIAVVGATASGKTSLAVALAKIYAGEVVSADSMQIYKGMDIATAKPTAAETDGVVHHLIDFLPAEEKYSVARYISDASGIIKNIHAAGKTPIIAGGTGLYVDSLIDNIVFEEEPDNRDIRDKLKKRRDEQGIESLYNELKIIDPETASSLHINNEGRVLRALEVYYLTGVTMSERMKKSRSYPSSFEPLYIGLDYADRQKLYNRTDLRVDMMLEAGLLEEARAFIGENPENTSAQAIGYKELKPYFDGTLTLGEAVDNLKRATRNYAKRQLTWFRKNRRIHWIYCDEQGSFDAVLKAACEITDNSGLFERR